MEQGNRAYGATEEGIPETASSRRHARTLVAALVVAIASVCLLTIVFSASVLDSATVLDQVNDFPTPTLKSLLGTFMQEQGAKKSDIASMDNYYKGASKKAPLQMLSDISDEFDPIEDADSNYGRVLDIKSVSRTNPSIPEDMDVTPERKAPVQMLDLVGDEFDPIEDADSNYGRVLDIKSVSRTNPSIPEDMDVSPERKAPVQMLYDVDGPQASDPTKMQLAKHAIVHSHHRQITKQKRLREMIEGGMLGTADKAKTQMLDSMVGDEFDPIEDADSNYGRVLDIKSVSRTNPSIPEDMDVTPERKAPVQMLDLVGDEFDPIEDADSNYGRVLDIKSVSRTNPSIPEDMDVTPERKAPVQMLDLVGDEFDPIEDADSNYGRVLDIKSVSRTNPSIPEDMDVSPERKAPVQMLYDIDGPQRSDAPRASWKASAKYDQGATPDMGLAQAIRAARPN